MLRPLLLLAVAAGLLPLRFDGGPGDAITADLITQPGHRYALDARFGLDADGFVPVIVLLAGDPGAGPRLLADLGPGVQVHRRFSSLIQGLALRVQPDALPALGSHPSVGSVHPDLRLQASLAESVPLVGAPQVWALTDGDGQPVTGHGIRVAILDTGIDYTHPALGGCFGGGCKVMGGYDFVSDDGDPVDDQGHGTHVSGIVAADGLLQGVAPGADLLAYKVLDANGTGYASDVIAGLERAVADGAAVINLSLGARGAADDPVSLAAQAAVDQGCVVVAAAGNGGPMAATVEAPAIAPGVIAVAASSKEDVLTEFSGRGPVPDAFALKPDLAAPGVQISSTIPTSGPVSDPSGWLAADGTSMAAPHVAGGAALLRQLHPDWMPLEVKAALMNYARDLGDDLFGQGAGRLDLAPAATPGLLALPASLSFGLPLLDGTEALTLTLRNLTVASLTLTPTLSLSRVADGAGQPISPTQPVAYAAITPASVKVPAGGDEVVTINLDIPPTAEDGHYQGRVELQAPEMAQPATVPLAFTLLSRVTVRVLDEGGEEITGWGHMAVLARVPDGDVLVSNLPLELPATFHVPPGEYYAQAYGRSGLYDHLLIPGLLPQVPYVAVQPVTVSAHAIQTISLDLADTRPYWLEAVDAEGNPAFLNAWAASLHHDEGEATWFTRLGQSYVRVLSTDLPDDWPPGFTLRLSDTPPGVSFRLALQGVGYTPRYRDFVLRHGALWPAGPDSGFGFPLTGSADRVEYLAWDRTTLDASTPPTFTPNAGDLAHYTVRTDLPGLLEPPWLGWEVAAEGWLDAVTGAGSGLEPIGPGLTRSLVVDGAHQAAYWAGAVAQHRTFQRPFYTADWSQTQPWDEDPNVLFPDRAALKPGPAGEGAFTIGAGPLYPALAFDNQPGAVQMRHPLLAGSSGSPVAWGPAPPSYTLTLEGTPVSSGTLPEYNWAPSPQRLWTDLPPGAYQLAISPTVETQGIGPGSIRAGFTLADIPSPDPNPPQVLDFALPQRFEPGTALTATWTLSDAGPVSLNALLRPSDGPPSTLAVEPLEEGRYQARIEPGDALTVSLSYTATDIAGNWLAWHGDGGATALAQVPATLTFELDPPDAAWGGDPVTVRIAGSLQGSDGQPLADAPAWLRLRAGGAFVGYVRDLTGSPGNYHTGDIDFAWTFIPANLAEGPGRLPISLEFDMGLYAAQFVTQTLNLHPPVYLPITFKGGAR